MKQGGALTIHQFLIFNDIVAEVTGYALIAAPVPGLRPYRCSCSRSTPLSLLLFQVYALIAAPVPGLHPYRCSCSRSTPLSLLLFHVYALIAAPVPGLRPYRCSCSRSTPLSLLLFQVYALIAAPVPGLRPYRCSCSMSRLPGGRYWPVINTYKYTVVLYGSVDDNLVQGLSIVFIAHHVYRSQIPPW